MIARARRVSRLPWPLPAARLMIGAGFIGGIGQRSAPALGISDRPIFGDRGRKSGTDPNEGTGTNSLDAKRPDRLDPAVA
jgi:hypothetical protein